MDGKAAKGLLTSFHNDFGDRLSQSRGSVLALPVVAPFPESCFPFRRLRRLRDAEVDLSSSETTVFT